MNSAEIFSNGMRIAARRITVSTAGWVPGILRMGREKRRYKLAVSLHCVDQDRRLALMPVAKKYPVADLLGAVREYYAETKLRVTFEYVLFEGFNDSDADAAALVGLAKRLPCKFNLIPYHDVSFALPPGGAGLRPARRRRLGEFAELLRRGNATVFIRSSAGDDIAAACGQLAVLRARGRRRSDAPSRKRPAAV
jgi:23S rRNA (adenine2503-C2)-methyltransferase